MMEFKGTKGKWVVDRYNNVSVGYNEITFLKSSTPNTERRANALLISKAPEMLGMLRSVLDLQISNYGDATSTHLDLIGKAKEIEQLIKEATEL